MKTFIFLTLAGIAGLASACNFNASSPDGLSAEDITICKWPQGRTAAISYTFDDNCPNQFSVVVPMLNEFNMKGTFFPVINWLGGNYDDIKAAAAQGHEIGSHTVSHPNLGELSDIDAQHELHDSRTTIEEVIGGNYKCITIAYPFCIPPKNIQLVTDDYIVARHCDGRIDMGLNDSIPIDFTNVSSHALGSVFNSTTAESLQTIFENTRAKGGWSNLLFHEIDEGTGYSPFPSEEIRKSLQYLQDNSSVYWVATMGDVARYIYEFNDVKIKVSNSNGKNRVSLSLRSLDPDIFNFPLTVLVSTANGPKYIDIVPNGEPVEI